jgi:hypothetical protein
MDVQAKMPDAIDQLSKTFATQAKAFGVNSSFLITFQREILS